MQGRILAILTLAAHFPGFSQEINVNGGFLNDHFKVGEEVIFWMSAKYPLEVNMVFPDSTYDFSPFEFVSKTYYKSQLHSGIVSDTVIYTLQSFEIDRVQKLSLPGMILKERDSIKVFTQADSLLLQELAPVVSDTTQLKTNLQYAKVDRLFNFPLFWIIAGVLVLIIGVVVLVFGKRILLAFKLRKLKKEYARFSDYLTEQIRELKVNPHPSMAEKTMTEWKKYFEKLESKPYSKLTSKEIVLLGTNDELKDPLSRIDRFVYGGLKDESLYKEFQSIEDFTQYRYNKVVDDLRHGK